MPDFDAYADDLPGQVTVTGTDRLLMIDANGVMKTVTVEAVINYAGGPTLGGYDLRVDDISWTPATPVENDNVVFTARIRNYGDAAMPAGTILNDAQLDVTFYVDNVPKTWSDQFEGPLAAGTYVDMQATGGGPGDTNYWSAVAGSNTIKAIVNDRQPNVRKPDETDFTNNTRSEVLTIAGSGGGGAPGTAEGYVWGAQWWMVEQGSGITVSDLLAHNLSGIVVQGQGNWWDSGIADIVEDYVNKGIGVCVGKNIGSTPDPTSPANIADSVAHLDLCWGGGVSVGATKGALDFEPYTYGDSLWRDVNQADITAMGTSIGNLAVEHGLDEIIVYCSSNASWPGSYNDLVLIQAGGSNVYANNKFRYFLDALCDVGVPVTHTDAVFHHGPQLSGYTWDTGSALSVQLAEAFHPNLRGSIMFWPDNNEGGYSPPNDGYAGGVTTAAAAAAQQNSTGTWICYHHHMFDNSDNTRWEAWLDEVLAGST